MQFFKFDCFDLSFRAADGDENEDWIGLPYMLLRRGDSKDSKFLCDGPQYPRSSSIKNTAPASQDDCINRNLQPGLFRESATASKESRRAAHNFQMGLTNVVDSCRMKKTSDRVPNSLHTTKSYSGTKDIEPADNDDMWYFRP
jgi:hypothetical protein